MSKWQITALIDGLRAEAGACSYELVEFRHNPDNRILVEFAMKDEWEEFEDA